MNNDELLRMLMEPGDGQNNGPAGGAGAPKKSGQAGPIDPNVYVNSVKEAEALLDAQVIPGKPGAARFRKQLIDFITDPENEVYGDCDTYHNLLMSLFRVGDYLLALKVCDFALSFAPQNRDILGDAIRACEQSSQFARGEKYIERAMEIPREKWSYRLFLYSIDFLKTKLDAYPMDDALYDQALALAREFIKIFPYDEHGYNQEAELMILMNHREEAIATLQRHIFETRPDERNSRSELITAQCCVTLLNILDDSNDYDFIIQICDRGLRNTAQEQPSARIGYFEYRRALALDAKARDDDFRPATVAEALRNYQVAYDLNQDRSYKATIEQRYVSLGQHAEDFKPLMKRPLFVDA